MKITLLTLLHNLIIDIYENLLLLPFVVVYIIGYKEPTNVYMKFGKADFVI